MFVCPCICIRSHLISDAKTCGRHWPVDGAMPPKRPKGQADALDPDEFSSVMLNHIAAHGSLNFGKYMCRSGGPWPVDLLRWSTTCEKLLSMCPSGLLLWDSLKVSFGRIFEENPKRDPFLKSKDYSLVESAEECASAMRRLGP